MVSLVDVSVVVVLGWRGMLGWGCWWWSEGGQPRLELEERGRRAWSGLQELVTGVVVGGVGLVG